MLRAALLFFSMLVMANQTNVQAWATAVSKNEHDGTVIVYRYAQIFARDFVRASQPDRVILVWRYEGEKGMPSPQERGRMDELEDALAPLVETEGFSTLALVSTGDNLKEWTYYTKSEEEFIARLNQALGSKEPFPIEIHADPDPQWSTYTRFISEVLE
jgi:hypothetical protein